METSSEISEGQAGIYRALGLGEHGLHGCVSVST